jgi:hypothetical protein
MPAVDVITKIGARVPQPHLNETSDITIRKLRLQGALRRSGIDVDVTNVLTDGHFEDTITGVPQIVLDVFDRDYKALQSGVFGQKVDVLLDRVPFRIVQVSLTDVELLELTMEHKIVALLREHTSPLKVARSSMTRAQFIELMLKEIAPQFPGLRYVSPEINAIQPIASSSTSGRSLTSKTLGSTNVTRNVRGSGFGLTHLDIISWDGGTATLGPSQLANAAIVFATCAQLGATGKALLAMIEACIVEPNAPFENSPAGGNGGSVGILQWGGGGGGPPVWANDVAQSVLHSLQDPGATGGGGMISLARNNPGWTAGQVAQREQGSAFPARYDQAQRGAQQVIDAFTAAGGLSALSGATNQTVGYEFTRGQPGQPEDSWTAGLRLAAEVNWRLFIVGPNAVYFVTDEDLLKAPVKYRIDPLTKGITQITFDAQVGGRTVVVKRHRQPRPSEAQIDCRIDRWGAPLGSVIELADYGPGDGRWLVTDIQRNLFNAEGTIKLSRAQKPFDEPANTTISTSGLVLPGAAGGTVGKVYAAAAAMDKMNLPYSIAFRTLSQQPPRGGYDCSAAVSWALLSGGLPLPNNVTWGAWAPVSGDFEGWGQPGRGAEMTVWCNSGHIFIEFYGAPAKRFDTVPGGSGGLGPHLRYTAPGDAGDTWEATGFAARHWPAT